MKAICSRPTRRIVTGITADDRFEDASQLTFSVCVPGHFQSLANGRCAVTGVPCDTTGRTKHGLDSSFDITTPYA
jgi:hypothetical protein